MSVETHAEGTGNVVEVCCTVEHAFLGGIAGDAAGEVGAGEAGVMTGLAVFKSAIVPPPVLACAQSRSEITLSVFGCIAVSAGVRAGTGETGVVARQAMLSQVVIIPLHAVAVRTDQFTEGSGVACGTGAGSRLTGFAGVDAGQAELVRAVVVELVLALAKVVGVVELPLVGGRLT